MLPYNVTLLLKTFLSSKTDSFFCMSPKVTALPVFPTETCVDCWCFVGFLNIFLRMAVS